MSGIPNCQEQFGTCAAWPRRGVRQDVWNNPSTRATYKKPLNRAVFLRLLFVKKHSLIKLGESHKMQSIHLVMLKIC